MNHPPGSGTEGPSFSIGRTPFNMCNYITVANAWVDEDLVQLLPPFTTLQKHKQQLSQQNTKTTTVHWSVHLHRSFDTITGRCPCRTPRRGQRWSEMVRDGRSNGQEAVGRSGGVMVSPRVVSHDRWRGRRQREDGRRRRRNCRKAVADGPPVVAVSLTL